MSINESTTNLHIILRETIRDRTNGSVDRLNENGGVMKVAEQLNVDTEQGVESVDVPRRRTKYGSNAQEPGEMISYFGFLIEAFSDFTIIMLAIAGLVSLGIAIGYSKDAESYAKGAAILISVLIVTNVTAGNEFNKQAQFAQLNATVQDVTDRCVRDGHVTDVKAADLVCGDIVQFKVGDILSADGLLIEGADVSTDESALTGEPKLIKKDPIKAPFLLSGTKVMEGTGTYLVIAVGVNSEAGQIRELVRDKKKSEKKSQKKANPANSSQTSPIDEPSGGSVLTAKLHRIAVAISKFAFVLAAVVLIITCVRFSVVTYALTNPDTLCAFVYNGVCGSSEVNSYASNPPIGGFPLCGPSNTVYPCCTQVVDGAKLLGSPCPWMKNHLSEFLSFLITAITIIVVVIPEGLPLAVTLSLAFSVRKMQSDNNLVKHLDACETMGSATIICSDKTGTLTKNRMTVVKSRIGMDSQSCLSGNLALSTKNLWAEAVATFGTADITFDESVNLWDQIGSKTECALLQTLPDLIKHEIGYKKIRQDSKIVKRFPFNSAIKKSSVVLQKQDSLRLYTIGASEIVLNACDFVLNENDGTNLPLTPSLRTSILRTVEEYANQAMRTIVVAYKDLPLNINVETISVDEYGLVFVGLVGIEDPLRDEVPNAIAKCRRAGVDVKMVTGDNLITAIAIAKNACIIRESDMDTRSGELRSNVAMTGPEFRSKVLDQDGNFIQENIDRIWPRLRVLARSSPTDKYILVSGIMASQLLIRGDRQVVAVTGDGTNDAPALKKADVGFAMGISGTAVARDAADIILLDDNFASIVLACKWGRNVYDSVAKFMQFQLTVMTVAIIIALEGVFIYYESPISAVQMLWINLIMNALASLSLATEPPTEALLDRPPYGRRKSMISHIMIWNIVGHAIYQLIILNLFFFFGSDWFGITDGRDLGSDAPPGVHFTLIFNSLVFMQLTNQINSRKLGHERNVFSGILRNPWFLIILACEAVLQVVFVQFGGAWVGTAPLPAYLWGYSVAVAFGSFPVQQVIITIRRAASRLALARKQRNKDIPMDSKFVPEPMQKVESISPSMGDMALARELPPIDIKMTKSSSFHFDTEAGRGTTLQRDASSVSLPNGRSRRLGGLLPSTPEEPGVSGPSRNWSATDRRLQRYFSHKVDEEEFLAAAREYRLRQNSSTNIQ